MRHYLSKPNHQRKVLCQTIGPKDAQREQAYWYLAIVNIYFPFKAPINNFGRISVGIDHRLTK